MRLAKESDIAPCYRNLDRRIVAMAAMTAILLWSTTGQASNMLFTIDSSQSSIALEIDADFGPAFSGGVQSYHYSSIIDSEHNQFLGPPPLDSNVNYSIAGTFTGTATGTPGEAGSTLQLDSGTTINLNDNGNYWPTLGAYLKTDAQFGFDSANFDVNPTITAAWAAVRGLTLDVGSVDTDTGDSVVDGGQLATQFDYLRPPRWLGTATALVATGGVLDMLVSDDIGLQHAMDSLPVLVGFGRLCRSWPGATSGVVH